MAKDTIRIVFQGHGTNIDRDFYWGIVGCFYEVAEELGTDSPDRRNQVAVSTADLLDITPEVVKAIMLHHERVVRPAIERGL
jgi:hypothetical protein